jgi:hypothetical protein
MGLDQQHHADKHEYYGRQPAISCSYCEVAPRSNHATCLPVIALPDAYTPAQIIWQLTESLAFKVIELHLNDKGAAVHRSSAPPSVRKMRPML